MRMVDGWRDVLREVANLPGWRFPSGSSSGQEEKLIMKIVERIECEVKQTYLNVIKHPVGLDLRVHNVRKLLKMGSEDVFIIGIHGVGGIGKTTIAKAVYSLLYQQFDACSFLENVKGVSKKPNGLVHLQELLLSELLKKEDYNVGEFYRGPGLVERSLSSKRVFIVLDDVDNLIQVDTLVGRQNLFGSGSRIIITTRDEHLLKQNANEMYNVHALTHNESVELFSWHAFKTSIPLKEYAELSHSIVTFVGGNPLVLEVSGSSMLGRNMIKWKRTLEKLRPISNSQTKEILRLCFDALDDDKLVDILLDVACFFIGMDKDIAITILNGCDCFAEIGISDLARRCLLTVDCRNELKMHDLIQDLVMEIICEKSPHNLGQRSRLWFPADVEDVLMYHKGTDIIEGIKLDQPIPKQKRFDTKSFERMQKLRLLQINHVNLEGKFDHLFEELRWLCWHYCPLKYLPSDFRPERLVVLDMQNSSINSLWHGSKFLPSLKILDLSHSECLTKTPNFTGVPNLEKLLLEGCTNLFEVHPSIGQLGRLVHLNINNCKNLSKLPSSISNLKLLEKLFVDGCSSLELFPQQLGNMKCLMELHASQTAIKLLPNSIGLLKHLVYLWRNKENAARYWILLFLSAILWKSSNTKRFWSPSISAMCSLRCLDLSYCNLSDGDVPPDLSYLSSLENLDLAGNRFSSLPSILCHLSNLEHVSVNSCLSLQSIPELPPNIATLDARDCISLYELPDLSNLQHLQKLDLRNCSRLPSIQGLRKLNFLQTMRMEGCSNLTCTFYDSLFQEYSERVVNCEIFLTRREIPDLFNYVTKGSLIFFDMPLDYEKKLVGITLYVVFACKDWNSTSLSARVYINDRRNATQWTHSAACQGTIACEEILWVSHLALRSFRYPTSRGERIEICIVEDLSVMVQECGIRLVYKQDVEDKVVLDDEL